MFKVTNYLMVAALVVSPLAQAGKDKPKQCDHKKHKTLSFAVIADAPYGDQNTGAFDQLIDDINRDDSVRFVMHGGDIKSGGSECSDERLQARFDQYQKFNRPFIYTPGDNEWTDCHRVAAGQYNPLERLDFIRELFYPKPGYSTGGRPMRLLSQASSSQYSQFVENSLFMEKGVIFSTVHVVGSNNNLAPWSGIDAQDSYNTPRDDRYQEFYQREAASLDWLKKIFALAKKKQAKGVFILIHANPLFELNYDQQGRAGFNAFLAALFEQTKRFDKPVLLAHGDSHVYFSDKPKLVPWYADGSVLTADEQQDPIPNLTRFQTFGDSPQHWVKVTVDPSSESVFSIEPQVVKANLH